MKIKSQTLIVAIAFFFLISCISGQTNRSSQNIEWINTWLTSPSCNPPCWEGITPGKTTLDQAYVILNDYPQILNAVKDTNYITWDFQPNNKGGNGLIFSEEKNGIVEIIRLRSHDGDILLGDVIEKFGEPDQVMFTASDSNIVITYLVYLKQGMALILGLKSKSPDITPTSNILGVDFFVPGYEFSWFELTIITSQVKWTGYSRYSGN